MITVAVVGLLTAAAPPFFGVVLEDVGGCAQVIAVYEKGPLAFVGTGDCLVSVGDSPVPTSQEARSALGNAIPGVALPLRFRDAGSRLVVPLARAADLELAFCRQMRSAAGSVTVLLESGEKRVVRIPAGGGSVRSILAELDVRGVALVSTPPSCERPSEPWTSSVARATSNVKIVPDSRLQLVSEKTYERLLKNRQ